MSTPASRTRRPSGWWILILLLTATRAVPAFAGGSSCGDGFCTVVEDCATCPRDCGSCESNVYICYDDQISKKTPQFTPVPNVEIHDAYSDLFFTVTGPREICNPRSGAQGEGQLLFDEDTHLNRYQIVLPKKTSQVLPKHVTVVDQFGSVTVDALTGDKLLVPAAKSLVGPPPPLEVVNVDHFKCYDVKTSKGTPKFPKGVQITLADEFTGIPVVWDVIQPAHLCPVAQKNQEPVLDPCSALMCYDVKRAKGQPKFTKVKPVYTNDQFGSLTLDAVDKDDVCVPAVILAGESGAACVPLPTTTSTTSTSSSTSTSTSTSTSSSTSSSTSTSSTSSSSTSTSTTSTTSTSSTTTTLAADLSLTKTASTSSIFGSQTVTFTVTLSNAGPGTATGVEVTDLLPAAFTYDSASASLGVYDAGSGVWSVGTLPSGSDATLEIMTQANSCGPFSRQTVTNTAEVTAAAQTDPDSMPGNHNSSEDDQAVASVFFGCD